MIVDWDGKKYEFDLAAGITVKEAVPVKLHTGLGVKSFWRAVSELEPEACQGLLWILKRRNGEVCDMASLDFDIVAFVNAFNAAGADEAAKHDVPKETPVDGSSAASIV